MDEQLQFCMHVITMTTSFSKLFLNWNQRGRVGVGGRGGEKKITVEERSMDSQRLFWIKSGEAYL